MHNLVESYKKIPARCPELECVHRFNNFVKAFLIKTYLKPCGNVLDMPCGRGGDLKKYKHNQTGFYCGLDIVPERVEDARIRYKNIRCMFAALFQVADFTQPLDLSDKYDLISCQFALHYAWKDQTTVQRVFLTCHERLCDSGYCIFTFPDSCVIFQRIKSLMEHQDEFNFVKKCDDQGLKIQIGGPKHSLVFQTRDEFNVFLNKFESVGFGTEYTYYQQGSIEYIPENVVNRIFFHDMVTDAGFHVVLDENFTTFLTTDARWNNLKASMLGAHTLDAESLDIINLYRAVVVGKGHKRAKRN